MIPSQRGIAGRLLLLVFSGALISACCQAKPEAPIAEAPIAEPPQDIAPNADKILHAACDYLAKTPQFSCSAEIWEDIVLPGTNHKMQVSRAVDVQMRRPDRLRADMKALGSRSIYYNGKTVAVFNRTDNLWGELLAGNTLDLTLDLARDLYNVEFPLADLVVSDPYGSATKNVRIGRYLGLEVALGIPCHHLGFSQDTIDWQIWIEDGPKPLIRKMVITYKLDEGSPQFTALLTKWDMDTALPDANFNFTAPAGVGKYEILPVTGK